jgi:hypothetical protein
MRARANKRGALTAPETKPEIVPDHDVEPAMFNGLIEGLSVPDDISITEWAERNLVLPDGYGKPGPFRASPWMRQILDDLKDPRIRGVTLQAAIQEGKTLIADIFVLWASCVRPGPIMWTWQNQDMAEEHSRTRLRKLLESTPAFQRRMSPDRHDTTNMAIYFSGGSLILNSATLNSLQSKSVRYKINSELWLPPWQGLLQNAYGRVSYYEKIGNSKILNESQPGVEGDEISKAFNEGTQCEWSVDCGGGHHPIMWLMESGDGSRAGVVWDWIRDEKGEVDIELTARTARYRCPKSGIEVEDSDVTRKRWELSGRWEAQNQNGDPSQTSYRKASIDSRPMQALVRQFLKAREQQKKGFTQDMIDFINKRLARSHAVKKRNMVEIKTADYDIRLYQNQIRNSPKTEFVVLAVDVQLDHMWYTAYHFTDTQIRLIEWGKVNNEVEVEAKRKEYGILPQCTCPDPNYARTTVLDHCIRFGWTPMKGEGKTLYSVQVTNKETGQPEMAKSIVSDPITIYQKGHRVTQFAFSGDDIKDLVHAALEKGVLLIPSVGAEEVLKHFQGEEKIEKKPGVHGWERIKQRDNHLFDTTVIALAFALKMNKLPSIDLTDTSALGEKSTK